MTKLHLGYRQILIKIIQQLHPPTRHDTSLLGVPSMNDKKCNRCNSIRLSIPIKDIANAAATSSSCICPPRMRASSYVHFSGTSKQLFPSRNCTFRTIPNLRNSYVHFPRPAARKPPRWSPPPLLKRPVTTTPTAAILAQFT